MGARAQRLAAAEVIALTAMAAVMLASASSGWAGTLWLKTCGSNGMGALTISSPPAGIAVRGRCPGGPIEIASRGSARAGARETLQATAPPGIAIVHFWIDNNSLDVGNINNGSGYGGGFYWAGGGEPAKDGMAGYSSPTFLSRYAGVQIVCGRGLCTNTGADVAVYDFNLQAVENSGPGLIATTPLWYRPSWIRGSWPLGFSARDASGVCDATATIGGQSIQGPTSGKDLSQWTQCHTPDFSSPINTGDFANGTTQLAIQAQNAAGVWSTATKTLAIDNEPVSIGISGPADAPRTAGVQHLTANASAGVSGISGISCSLDDAPWQHFAQASVAIPVSGVGVHRLTCYAANNAEDTSGSHAASPPQTRTLSIREPTVSTASFSRVVDALRCRRVRERIRVPARWVSVRRHRRLMRLHKGAHTEIVTVVRCHPRTERRRVTVWVTVRRNGKKIRLKRSKIEQVVVLPHVANNKTRQVRFGRGTTVSGWLGTAAGTALGGATVRVLSAPDNGKGDFTQVALATTASDGSWSARLARGPSRLLAAVYEGGATTEPSISVPVRIVVPAVVRLEIHPRRTNWGGRIQISGRVLGGYIPGARQQLLRLRIGADGIYSTVGIPDIQPDGSFHTTWTFHPGTGVVRYWFSVSTLNEADYPYAPASSSRMTVSVGPG